jgi:hypothetical protein
MKDPISRTRCPYCHRRVKAKNLYIHVQRECLKSPAAFMAGRSPARPKSKAGKNIHAAKRGHIIKNQEAESQRIAYAKFVRAQRDAMPD